MMMMLCLIYCIVLDRLACLLDAQHFRMYGDERNPTIYSILLCFFCNKSKDDASAIVTNRLSIDFDQIKLYQLATFSVENLAILNLPYRGTYKNACHDVINDSYK